MRALLISLALISCAASAQTVSKKINDTGIDFCRVHATGADTPVTATTTCAAAQGGQDARYGRDPAAQRGGMTKIGGGTKGFDFTKISHSGVALPASAVQGNGATDWACTYDNATGLMWEVKTAAGDGGLHDASYSYSWYDSVHVYGGNSGTPNAGSCQPAGRCDTAKFVADVNASNLCNHNDWRMPTVDELANLLDLGIALPGPLIDSSYFPNTAGSVFWSGSPFQSEGVDAAWAVAFDDGMVFFVMSMMAEQVRLVRVGP